MLCSFGQIKGLKVSGSVEYFYDMRSDISVVVIRLTYYLHKLKSFHRSNTDVNLTQFFGGGGSFSKR